MVVTTVLAPKPEVFEKLEQFLVTRKFRIMESDSTRGFLQTKKKHSLLRKPDHILFLVKSKSPSATDIEVTVNRHRTMPSRRERLLEEKLRSRLYFYF